MNLFSLIMEESGKHAVVWSIAGSDSSGGAGAQADLKTLTVLGSYGATVITAVTAQNTQGVRSLNPVSVQVLQDQLESLTEDLVPKAIKIGMLASADQARQIIPYLKRFEKCFVIYDPVRASTSGTTFFSVEDLQKLTKDFLPYLNLITPNIPETEEWLQVKIQTPADIQVAAQKFCEIGARAVLIKGGHAKEDPLSRMDFSEFQNDFCSDYFFDGTQGFWITTPRVMDVTVHGTGCSYATAIAHFCAQGYDLKEAIVLAKTWLQQSLRHHQNLGKGQALLGFDWHIKNQEAWLPDFPWVTRIPFDPATRPRFPKIEENLGLYAIVPRAQMAQDFFALGVRTIQLRIKDLQGEALESEIKAAAESAKNFSARLFVNDYADLAQKYGAYGVHLGQDDLRQNQKWLLECTSQCLGISTHSFFEAAVAHFYRPSYVALGPIFKTESHPVAFPPQGVNRLKIWKCLFDYPLVAIGGIKVENGREIIGAGVSGVAVMSELTEAQNPRERIQSWQKILN